MQWLQQIRDVGRGFPGRREFNSTEDHSRKRNTFDEGCGEQHVGEDLTLHFGLTSGGFTSGSANATNTETSTKNGNTRSKAWNKS